MARPPALANNDRASTVDDRLAVDLFRTCKHLVMMAGRLFVGCKLPVGRGAIAEADALVDEVALLVSRVQERFAPLFVCEVPVGETDDDASVCGATGFAISFERGIVVCEAHADVPPTH